MGKVFQKTLSAFSNQPPAMPKQHERFSDDADLAQPDSKAASAHKLAVSALQFGAAAISPAQKRFNQLLKQSETLARKIEDTRQLADAHRQIAAQTLAPLVKEHSALLRQMALWIDARLQRKGLSTKQKHMAIDILSQMAAALADNGDQAMADLFDKYNDISEEDDEKEAASNMKMFMEDLLGESIGDDDAEYESIEDLMRAATARMHAKMAEEVAAHEHKQGTRKKSATQRKAEAAATAQADDATGALRTIYRQLVSALHPDREQDPKEQLRKTALMKEANTAYEKRDLLALLQLQLRAELTDSTQLVNMAKEKMTALTTLLKDRVKVLTQELYALERQMIVELDLPMFSTLSPGALRRHLKETEQEMRADIAVMQHDLIAVQDDAFFKRWLRQQQQATAEVLDFPF